jgi:hypothetical protein
MTNLIYLALGVLVFLFIAKTSITFSPFTVHMERPGYAFGWFLLYAGITFIILSTHVEAYENGLKKGIEIQKDKDNLND